MQTTHTSDRNTELQETTSLIWSVLSGLVLLTTLVLAGLFLFVYIGPYQPANPLLEPPAQLAAIQPSATITPLTVLPATWTPQPSATLQATQFPTPTATEIPTENAVQATFSGLPTQPYQTPLPQIGYAFVLQDGNPLAILNIGHPEQGCNWTGVAGQANGMNGAPVVGLLVQLGGWWDGKYQDPITITGSATQYGAGGFEFALGEQPMRTTDSLWVQLFDQAMIPLSEKVYFETFESCEKNLILVNFNQVR